MKIKKSQKADTCGSCMFFGKSKCPFTVEADNKICKRFQSLDDYKEVSERVVKFGNLTVKVIAYTWKGSEPKVKMITIKNGGKSEYVSKEFPRLGGKEALKVGRALVKMAKELIED